MKPATIVQDYRSKCFDLVQKYIDFQCRANDREQIEQFLLDCEYLNRAYYEDIVDERACIRTCGYVLCSNQLSPQNHPFKQNQTYHIRKNRVYSVEQRKKFCSDLCFKHSEFVKQQISTEPIYLR